MTVRDRLVDSAYAAGWAAIKAVPHRVAATGFRLGADLGYRRQGPGVRRLASNLRRVVPAASEAELAALTRQAYRSYARFWLETFRLPVMGRTDVASRVEVEGVEHVRAGLALGRGVVIGLPHLGNYDACTVWMVENGLPFTTVAERLEPESLFHRFLAYRESLGMEVLPLQRGEKPPSEVLTARLQAGRLVCLVADRDLSASGVPVTFFGEPTRMPAGPSFLAAMTGAVLVPAAMWFTDTGWHLRFHPPIPLDGEGRLRERVSRATQALADHFAEDIAAHPQDWHMLQRMWPDQPPAPAAARPESELTVAPES